jgi:hypothetical protein
MDSEPERIAQLFEVLVSSPIQVFPTRGLRLDCPDNRGVYVIYSPAGSVLHVGRTPRARNGLRQRLNNHLRGQSSFSRKHLAGDGDVLRGSHSFRCIDVEHARDMALLEAYAIGCLCPAHLGLHETRPGASSAPPGSD